MSQSYSGYSTGGYSLPNGFSVVIRFRRAADRELGPPWLSYRSRCDVCGEVSSGMDRRDYMQKWLVRHRGHNAEWKDLTVDAFDFKVDQRVRDWYAVYVRLLRRGVLEGGIRRAVRSPSPRITTEEKEMMTSLLEVVEASRVFDDAAFSESARTRSRQTKRPERDASVPKKLGGAALPQKGAKRKAKPPVWMRHSDQWVVGDTRETASEEELAPHVLRQEERGETPLPAASSRSVVREVPDLLEQAELVLAERLLCGNVTKRKDKQSLICDVTERDASQQQHRVSDERVGWGRLESVVWLHRGQIGDFADGSRLPRIDTQPAPSVDPPPAQMPSVHRSQLFSLGGPSPLLAKMGNKNGDDRLYYPSNAERDVSPATRFPTLSRSMSARRGRGHWQ